MRQGIVIELAKLKSYQDAKEDFASAKGDVALCVPVKRTRNKVATPEPKPSKVTK